MIFTEMTAKIIGEIKDWLHNWFFIYNPQSAMTWEYVLWELGQFTDISCKGQEYLATSLELTTEH